MACEIIIDPARFVADPDKAKRFPELPYVTLRLAYMACEYFKADLGLAIVRPEHQAFYRRVFLHETIAEPRLFPGLIKPVESEGRVLVDGGAVNPLPYDLLFEAADVVIAVDVTFGGSRERRIPPPFNAMFGAAQIMQGAITAQKLKLRAPDVLVRPPVEQFRVLDFFRAAQILRASDPAKEEIKRRLGARLEAAAKQSSA